jgi:hypothetical protein
MENAKKEIQELISNLPEGTTLEDIQYHLYVLQKIKRGLSDIDNEKLSTNEEMKQRFSRWLEK